MKQNIAVFFSDIDDTICDYSQENYKKYFDYLEKIRIKNKADILIFSLITYNEIEKHLIDYIKYASGFLTDKIILGNQFFPKGIILPEGLILKKDDNQYQAKKEYYKCKADKIYEYILQIKKNYNVVLIGYADDYFFAEDIELLLEYLKLKVYFFIPGVNSFHVEDIKSVTKYDVEVFF